MAIMPSVLEVSWPNLTEKQKLVLAFSSERDISLDEAAKRLGIPVWSLQYWREEDPFFVAVSITIEDEKGSTQSLQGLAVVTVVATYSN